MKEEIIYKKQYYRFDYYSQDKSFYKIMRGEDVIKGKENKPIKVCAYFGNDELIDLSI